MKFKKPKFWDLKKQNIVSYLLHPFTIFLELNNFILSLISKKKIKDIKSICIGNIYVGGTGKTPATIKLYNIFKKMNFKVCTGKKYYSDHSDEQIILKNKTNLICENNRIQVVNEALKKKNEIIIFDDGLQDRTLDYDFKIVCFDADNWLGNGQLIPSGPLREKLTSLKNYDAIFLKNQNSNINEIKEIIKQYNSSIKIFQTNYYPKNISHFDLNKKYLIFSGIGNPKNFKNTLIENKFNIVGEINFPDHYDYKKVDIDLIKHKAKKLKANIITTEKDFVKIAKTETKDINFLEIDLKIEGEIKLMDFIKMRFNEKY